MDDDLDAQLIEALGRLPGETNVAWQALIRYARMGGGGGTRSLRRLAREGGHTINSVTRWSSVYRWQERVEQADRVIAEMRLRVWAQRRLDVDEQDYQDGDRLRALARRVLAQTERLMDTGEGVPPGVAGRALEIASKLQRLATGAPTEREEHQLSPEFIRALEVVYGGDGDTGAGER